MSLQDAVDWANARLEKIDTTGRDALYTHLIQQEIQGWFHRTVQGQPITKSEVDLLIQRRGFNANEAKKFRRLASFFCRNRLLIIHETRRGAVEALTKLLQKRICRCTTSR